VKQDKPTHDIAALSGITSCVLGSTTWKYKSELKYKME